MCVGTDGGWKITKETQLWEKQHNWNRPIKRTYMYVDTQKGRDPILQPNTSTRGIHSTLASCPSPSIIPKNIQSSWSLHERDRSSCNQPLKQYNWFALREPKCPKENRIRWGRSFQTPFRHTVLVLLFSFLDHPIVNEWMTDTITNTNYIIQCKTMQNKTIQVLWWIRWVRGTTKYRTDNTATSRRYECKSQRGCKKGGNH